MAAPGGLNELMLATAATTGNFQVPRSLRGRSSNSNYMNRTPGSAGNTTTATWSGWVKRVSLGSNQGIVASVNSVVTAPLLRFTTTDKLEFVDHNATAWQLITTQVFRDVAQWIHIVVAVDTTQGTSSNRVKIYINGSQVTAFDTSTYPSASANMRWTGANVQYLFNQNVSNYADFYGAQFAFVDGQQLTPSTFAATDTTTGQWIPKDLSSGITWGTTGYWLKFADNSSVANLGTDSSGNSNTWTVNNFSITSGVTNDSLVDSISDYGTDTGAGNEVRGNYCTLNPLDPAKGTYANGNLKHTVATGGDVARGTFYMTSGKWYFEALISWASSSDNMCIGVVGASQGNTYPVSVATVPAGMWLIRDGGVKINNGASTALTAYTSGQIVGVAFDVDNGKIWWRKNDGTWQEGDPAAGTGASYTNLTLSTWGGFAPCCNEQGVTGAPNAEFNFGQRPFANTAPSGFKALCTQNMTTPAVVKSSTAVNINLRTGTGAAANVTGFAFQPDLVWIKSRSNATNNNLFDSVRGVQKGLVSNGTAAEYTDANSLTAFNSDGFSVGTDGSARGVNVNTNTYVDWMWKKAAANGVDIVGYTGDGTSNRNINHSLGVAPKFVIVRDRSSGGTTWWTWHTGLTAATYYLELNSTAAQANSSTPWGTGNFSSSQFMVSSSCNTNLATYVAYLFTDVVGFSKFGSYTGNASTDGFFVALPFAPKLVILKNVSAGTDWIMVDSSRPGYNQASVDMRLFPHLSSGEDNTVAVGDLLSNGFKLRTTNTSANGSSTIVYAAFAEYPINYSRGK